ncbi:MAG: glycosyltransferase [Oscillospiraceae bacterium]
MSDKLNVCLMNDSFPPLIDGVANCVVNYADVISRQLGSATVVTPDNPGANDEAYPFEVLRYKSMHLTEKLCGYRAGYPFSSSRLETLANKGFDVIHSHCPFASTVMARVLREKSDAPLILTYHTKFDIDIRRALPTKILADAAINFVVNNISACDEVWTVSKGAGENLRSLGYEGEYIVMENGVDFPCGRAARDEVEQLRNMYGFTEDIPVFMFVGRLLWYKGLRLTFDALKILSEKGIDYRMMVVGDGMDRAEMEEYVDSIGIRDKVIFTGAVFDREDLRVYYTAGDLFVFPSLYDTNGIVVREAAACGVASLLIEGSCAAEGITHGRTGVLTKDEPQAIAAELEFAASHLDEVRQIGQHAMEEVYISWETAVMRAYDRYHIVAENVKSGHTYRSEHVIAEDFFLAMNSITNMIQTFRSLPANIRKGGRSFGNKFKRRIDEGSVKDDDLK